MTAPYYMAALDLNRRRCVIVGGGSVAERKIEALLESGAEITVISPNPSEAIEQRAAAFEITLFRRAYRFGDLESAWIAVAATDSREINHQVYEEAVQRRMLINTADSLQECNYAVPAVLNRGDVRIAVTSGGQSPVLAQRARDEIAKIIGPEYGRLAELLGTCRREVHRLLPDASDRRTLWNHVASAEMLELVRQGRDAEVRDRVIERARALGARLAERVGATAT